MIISMLQVHLAGGSGVTKNIKEPGDYGGFPAVSVWFYFLYWKKKTLHSTLEKKNAIVKFFLLFFSFFF